MFIYKATSKTTGKVYIGQSSQTLQERISQHNSAAYKHQYNYHFHNAIRKYGKDDFIYEIIEDNISDIETLNERECFWISYYDSYNNGYNSTRGGGGKLTRDDELILRLFQDGKTTKEICEITGYNRSTIYKSYKALQITEENKSRKNEGVKQRCSRKVEQYSLSGEYIKTWNSSTECGNYFGNQGLISALCRQEPNTLSAYGYLFKYEDDIKDISDWVKRFNEKKNGGRAKKAIGKYDTDLNLICVYESAAEAAKAMNKKDKSNICAAARKGVKAYGYYWKYE